MYQNEKMVSLILLTGELLLTSGAEIYRVEETAERMGHTAGFTDVEVYTTPTGFFLTLVSSSGHVFTRVRRVRWSDNNLANIARVNALARQFASGDIGLAQLEAGLLEIKEELPVNNYFQSIVGGIGSGAFAIIFGGSLVQALYTILVGFCVKLFLTSYNKKGTSRFIGSALGAAIAAALGLLGNTLWGFPHDITILSGVMILVPGVAMTVAIRDMISGELVSGVARGAEAITIAVAVAAGVAFILGLGGF